MKTRLLAFLAVLAPLAFPGSVSADATLIDGDSLNVFAGEDGRLQARFEDESGGQFFSSGSDEANAGLTVGLVGGQGEFEVLGFRGTLFTAVSRGAVTGAGTQASPLTQVTTYRGIPASVFTQNTLLVTQTIRYVNGTTAFDISYTIQNESGPDQVIVRPVMAADLHIGGSDSGTGILAAGPPRFVGGLSASSGGVGGIVEQTRWARFEEDGFGTVFSHADDPSGTALDNTVNPDLVDNGVAVQWADTPIPPGGSATFDGRWHFARFFSVDPLETSNIAGQVHRLDVRSSNLDGSPAGGQTVRYAIDGTHPSSGTVTTGPNGEADIAWRGRSAGFDSFDVYWDQNGDGIRQDTEPQRSGQVQWLGPPLAGSTFNARVLDGEVFIRPAGGSAIARRLRARPRSSAAPPGFVSLSGAETIPIGSTVETSRGKVLVQSARGTSGGVQNAEFFSGRFQLRQRATRRAVTEMVLKGGSFRRCGRSARGAAGGPDAEAARRRGRRVRRLWGNGRGRFRTRGRRSSATVRGTKWLVSDHCNGTLTRVPRQRGRASVDVRDFTNRRTVRVREGRSYFAPNRRSRRR